MEQKPQRHTVETGSGTGAGGKSAGLLRSSLLVSSMTMLSRVLGLVRDIVFAVVIGATSSADAFFVAFKIPNFLRRLFAEGAFSQAFVPVLSEYRHKGSEAAVKALVDRVAGCLGSVLIMMTAIAVIASPVIATVFAPGFWHQPEKFALTSDLVRITFPYLLFISMTGLAGGILNSYDRFAVPAFTPVLLNVSLIAAAVLGSPWFDNPAYALGWGVFAAGVVQLLFQLPFLQRIHMLPAPKIDWKDEGVRKILRLMAPAIFGVSVSQINLLLDTVIASLLPNGSVSWLYYSDRLIELPLGVFGVAVATVILPKLSRQHAAESAEHFNRTLDWGLRFIVLIAVPATVALMALARPILMTLFYHGDVMTLRDIDMSVLSLRAFALGLLAFMSIKVLATGFYARQDMKTPVRIGIIAMASNMVLNIIFVVPLHIYYQIGHVGLALATASSAFINALLLFRGLHSKGFYQVTAGWTRFFRVVVIANLAMLALLLGASGILDAYSAEPWWLRVVVLLGVCGIGAIIYGLALLIQGVRVRDFRYH
ncbi:MAG: murein biosynthesis integral membrane protein MurJ [bacterium]